MLVIAHRGANRFAPQNTLHAFKKAAELNSDGVETDVHLTKDGQLVLCHNETVNKTSNGKGKISEMSLKELRNFDFGSWFGNKFKDTLIPTLDEFLHLMKDTAVSVLNIELKPQKNGNTDFVEKVIEKAKSFGVEDKLFISSFDSGILNKVKEIDSSIKTGYLYPSMGEIVKRKFISPLPVAKKCKADFILPHHGYVSKNLINKAHDLGIKVGVWTVNKIESVERLVKIGVDGIITDVPDIIKNKVESM